MTKPVIYQLIPRLFANYNTRCVPNGSLKQNHSGKLNLITPEILDSLRDLGATHVWYTGVIEHAHDADYTAYGIPRHNPHIIKGKAGSPYAITDYYDIDPDLATDVPSRLHEFDELVERTHNAGLKVVIDFVPNHVGRQYASDAKPAGIQDLGVGDNTDMFFSPTNNFYYITRQQFEPHIDLGSGSDRYIEFPAKASGNDCFTAFPGPDDWYETVKLNYGIDYGDHTVHFNPIPPTWYKMLHILRYWAARHIDAFRCDMAHMVPVEFWRWAIADVRRNYPDIRFIAEIYDTCLYHSYIDAGFDYLYDKVNLYDTLRAIRCYNTSAARLTDCWQRIDGMQPHMLNFLENHDEQRYASPQFAGNADTVLPLLTVSATISTGPFMIYFGQELGESARESEGFSGLDGRTTIFDYWSIGTVRRWLNEGHPGTRLLTPAEARLREMYRHILRLLNSEPAISRGQFFDLMYVNYNNPTFDPHRQYAYLRHSAATKDTPAQTLLVVANFADHEVSPHVNIPEHALTTLGLTPGDITVTDMLRAPGATAPGKQSLSSTSPIVMQIPANSAVILQLKPLQDTVETARKTAITKKSKKHLTSTD